MTDREVNPLESRYMALTARCKAAWAYHQLLLGVQRMSSSADFRDQSTSFQGFYGKLKELADKFHRPVADEIHLKPFLVELESELSAIVDVLRAEDERVTPSSLRRYFQRVRSVDERVLIEVVRFYFDLQAGRDWSADRLDKADFLLSRLAETVAGPGLAGDRTRLQRVLKALTERQQVEVPAEEVASTSSTLQNLNSEVRWVKTFDELQESRLVKVYRTLKHDLGARMFHPQLLPLILEVNAAFRNRVEELREWEESRILEGFQQFGEVRALQDPQDPTIGQEIEALEAQIEALRDQSRADDVRIEELAALGAKVSELAERAKVSRVGGLRVAATASVRARQRPGVGKRSGLVPDIEALQPYWSDLLGALASLDNKRDAAVVVEDKEVLRFRLEAREVVAYRHSEDKQDETGCEEFILAAAALRYRIGTTVEEVKGRLSETPGRLPDLILEEATDAVCMGDAFVKHFAHLTDQAVLRGESDEARALLWLQTRLTREFHGLAILLGRFREAAHSGSATGLAAAEGAVDTAVERLLASEFQITGRKLGT